MDVRDIRPEFEYVRELGVGAFGTVYEIFPDPLSFHTVALKVFETKHLDPELKERFRREIRILRQLSHPHIVSVLESGPQDDPPWFTMPLAVHTLADSIQDASVGHSDLFVRFDQILSAVQFLHSQGIFHRDIKPQNILVMEDGRAVLSDFGLGTRSVNESQLLTSTGLGAGTQGYVAPEQIADIGRANHLSDIYSLGKVFLEVCIRKPISECSLSDAPVEYRSLIERMTEHDPSRRPASVQVVISVLQRLRGVISVSEFGVDQAVDALADIDGLNSHTVLEVIGAWENAPDFWEATEKLLPLFQLPAVYLAYNADSARFMGLLCRVLDSIPRNVDFVFLDPIGGLVEMIFTVSTDPIHRRICLERLLNLAAFWDRYSLGRTFARLAATLKEIHDQIMIEAVLELHPDEASWVQPYLRRQNGASYLL